MDPRSQKSQVASRGSEEDFTLNQFLVQTDENRSRAEGILFVFAMAKTVDDLEVYRKAMDAARAISELLKHAAFRQDRELGSQLNRGSIRVPSDIAEGFEQKTDRHFARYLYDAKGGAREICTQLELARGRRYITDDEHKLVSGQYLEIARMLRGAD